MELILIKQDSPEWELMWNWLANHPINENIPEPSISLNEGEAWQYMGSWRQGERILHSFRHRYHPKTQNVYNVSMEGTRNLSPDQIQVEKNIRL